ncbi:MAG: hypothetical protein HZA17_08625 [Nitrospirae bacterium]|nr:hypothetical protein [Nitrospirota bacterium]
MAGLFAIDYSFGFRDGGNKTFSITLDRDTLSLSPGAFLPPPSWAELQRNRCSNCTLDETVNSYCPVAQNLSGIVEEFKDYFSYEGVTVIVSTEDRQYTKDTTIQAGLSSLIGIIMVTSGCPVLEHLKPMVRFHLPFATIEETIFRMTSMYLMSQFFLLQDGRAANWSLEGLSAIYSEVSKVNRDFAQRLAEAAKKDANLNALVNLDCFASMIPLTAETTLKGMRRYFSAYLG